MDCYKCHSPTSSEEYFLYDNQQDIQYACHGSCFNCIDCGNTVQPEEKDRCFVSTNDEFVCSQCYKKRFDFCLICQSHFEQGDFAMVLDENVKIHPACYKCQTCAKILSKGDSHQFLPESNTIFCSEHAQISQIEAMETISEKDNTEANQSEEETEDKSQNSKKRTPRTKFTEAQTQMLQNIFTQTPRPTRLMRENLAKQTGLNIRCIQIWFQNKRSKEKRSNAKRIMHSASWFTYPYAQPQAQPMFTSIQAPILSPPQNLYPSPPPADNWELENTSNHANSGSFYHNSPPSFEMATASVANFPSPPYTENYA